MQSRFPLLVALVMSTLASACDDDQPFEGSFALSTIGGVALPAPTRAQSTDTVFADTISVQTSSFGVVEIEHRLLRRGSGGRVQATYVDVFRIEGDELVYVPPVCPPNADCIYIGKSAKLDGSQLRVTSTSAGFREQIFVRF